MLRDNLLSAETERDRLRESCKGLELGKAKGLDELTTRHSAQIEELEQELEEKERSHETQTREVQHQSEEQLSQLKTFYEQEKQRLEQRYADEKDRN